MLLAIDCGNSETTFALVAVGQAGEKHAIEATWRVATADVSAETLGAEFATASVQGSIIANVVPDFTSKTDKLCAHAVWHRTFDSASSPQTGRGCGSD